jgi:putative transposase
MEQVVHQYEHHPDRIQVDNGSEFKSKVLDHWAYHNKVTMVFPRPGKPTDKAYIESFNGSFRDECLNIHWFLSLEDARKKLNRGGTIITVFVPTVQSEIVPRMKCTNHMKL